MFIESLQNKKVKEWCKLKEKKYRDETGLFLIEGDHLILEAEKLQVIKEIISVNKEKKADFYVTKEVMQKISNQKSISESIAICYKLKEEEIGSKVLVLDGIQDPGNLGTILRSAVAFSFDTVILSEDTVDLYNDKTIRATEGMLFKISIIRKNIEETLNKIQKDYEIYITNVKNGENIKKRKRSKKFVLVIGNEGNGVKESTQKFATHFIKIPMNSNCESLNAGVAASILMYEMDSDCDE